MTKQNTFRIGVDVGGTFTDIVFVGSDGTTLVKKVSSTPPDYSHGIASGIEEVLSENDLSSECIEEIIHGTTIVTNTIVEPETLDHRYITEDVPYGLIPISELGRKLGVTTPLIDSFIEIASMIIQKDFRKTGP